MKINWYKILLYLLRSLIYIKRGLFWLGRTFWKGVRKLDKVYQSSVGFLLYKFIFYFKKNFKKLSFTRQESKLEFFGRRGTLQVFLFVIVFVIMLPHSKLYTKEYDDIAGHNTLLYQVVGSGDQNFGYDEITLAQSDVLSSAGETWKQGSVVVDFLNEGEHKELQDLTSVTAGGSALVKPIIMPGVNIGNYTGSNEIIKTGRSDIVYYEVQTGDVIGKIAEKFGISISTILWANDLSVRSYIRPGDNLAIMPVDGLTHKVVRGDTVSKIASKYNAELEDIVEYNKLQKDGADIVIGEVLIIPGGKKPQPVRTTPRYVASRPSSFNKVVAPTPSVSAPAGSGYLWPTTLTYISQYYGWRHGGLDLAGSIRSPIYATKAGTVIVAQCGWNWGYGCYARIDHGNGIESIYAHMVEQPYVAVGDYVNQGQIIGAVGSTGNSTGPHLHFEIRINGKRQNPLAYIRR